MTKVEKALGLIHKMKSQKFGHVLTRHIVMRFSNMLFTVVTKSMNDPGPQVVTSLMVDILS